MDPVITPVLEDSVPPVATPAPAPAPEPAAPQPTPSPEPGKTGEGDTPPAPPAAEPELYELPDGRKVPASELSKEWKENFLPEFTRRSQKLAEYEAPGAKQTPTAKPPTADDIPAWQKEDFVPGSYADLIRIAKEEAIKQIQQDAQASEAQARAVTEEVDKQVLALKAKDPTLDENALFTHAMRFNFRDLNAAYANMIAFREVARETEERVTKGQTRKDPIAAGGTPQSAPSGALEPGAHSNFRSATEFMRHIKGTG